MRNPLAKIIKKPLYKLRVVKPKKGKGSYKRKDRVKRSFYLGAGKVLTSRSQYPCPYFFLTTVRL